MNRSNGTSVTNMCQKLEHMCLDVDEFVCKEPVLFVGNQMQTVGKNVKNFFSGFVDPVKPSKLINLVQNSTNSVVEIKENTVDSNTNNPKEASSIPNELCHKSSSTTDLCHLEQITSEIITSEISQYPIGEKGSLVNNTSDNTTQVNINSSTNIQDIDYMPKEKEILYDESSNSNVTANEYADWGIENILDLDSVLDDDNFINEEPLMNLVEKKTLLNGPTDELELELERRLNASTTRQSSDLENSIARDENEEEDDAKHIIAGGLSSERFTESLNSSFQNSIVEPDANDSNLMEIVDDLSISSDNLSSCGSFTTLSFDSNNEAHLSCFGSGLADGSIINSEEFKNDAVENCVIVEGGKLSSLTNTPRSKSYKKMIQDAFLSRKRLNKEYKQLAIWYADIDKEFSQPTESSSKTPAQDLPDSEWEFL